ncbi:hypothetical protein N657DRAFT_625486 [Parathielavia appendiculata]|uniref:Defective in cullin neddylation protein n=1 Tax=Parathielavia appendiculata TaxID=2587402 RepID=A0AAN6Z097_9PEZI|nr:hypothetical protein N657DRAFT_625486 [Parathielavia appendiculata]
MPATSTRRHQLAAEQFVSVTKASRDDAQAYLRNNNYDIEAAVNQFYSDSANGPPNVDQALEAMFDSLATETSKDELDMDGTIAYCQALNVDPASYEFFVLADIVQVQSFGQITRQGFVKGWKRATTVSPDMDAHQQYVQSQIRLVKTDAAVFRKVYRSAFVACKEAGKRELDMGEALTYWEVLFEPTMHGWATANVEWLEAWKGYLTEKFWVDKGGARKWTRSVSRDLWNQILLFAERTMADETLGFWSEDQAWPGLIDEFVVWCKEKGIVKAQNEETMELEE